MYSDNLINGNLFTAGMLLYNMTGEQLSYELFKWLSGLQVIPSSLRYKSNGNFQLDMRTADGLINGSLLAKLLMQLALAANVALNEPLLSSIKQSSTPAAKAYNWNILSEGFLKLNVTISKETAKEISSGNFPALTRFLLDLQKRFLPKRIQKKENGEELDLVKIQAMSTASDGGTFLEGVVFLLSQQLGLTPKQAASTLGEHAKYYAHLVVKGLKGGFSEVISLVKALKRQVDALLYLAERNPQRDTALFLDLVKPTLISRQAEVAREGAILIKEVVECSLKYNSKNLPYQLLSIDGGFDFLYMAIKRHPDLTPDFCHFLQPLVGNALSDFLEGHLRRTINNQQQYLKVLLKIVEGFASTPTGREQLRISNLIPLWLKQSELSFEDKKGREQNPAHQETKLLYLELLCNLWKDFSADIGQQQAETLLMRGIQQLKKNTRTQIYSVKVPALLRLFDFLHFLADSKNRMAAVIYKKLIFLMIQNHEQEEMRELILNNFRIMLVQYPSIPVDLLLEPLLRQLTVSQGKSYILNLFDFEFLIQAGRHPRLQVALALSFLQYLSKLYIHSIIYAKLVFRVIEVLTSRFCQEQTIIQFLKRNVQSTLNLYGMLVLGKKKSTKQTVIINKQRKSLSLQLIKHYSQLQHRQLSLFIQNKLTSLYVSWIEDKKYSDKGLNYLISLFGDPEELVMQYKIIRKQQEIDPPSPIQNAPLQTPKTQSYKEIDYMKEKGLGYKPIRRISKTRMQEVQERQASKPSVKAVKDIQALKEKMKEDVIRKRAQQELQLRRASQQNNLNSLQLLQRNLSLGYAKLSPLQQSQLFEFDSVKPKQLKWTSRFHQLSQLQDQDQKSAQVILKQYAKEIKSLFLKYALMSATADNRKDESNAVMSFTEVMKMLKEKGIDIGKLVASDLIATINYSKRRERNVLGGIQQAEFPQFLLKTTDFLIQQETNAMELPFGLRLQRLIISLLQGQAFYQNRFRNKQLQQIARLKQAANSDSAEKIQIPEGFKKVKENCVETEYKLNQNDWGVPSRLQIGYEIADWLLSRCIGIHIVTPLVRIGQRFNIIQVPKPIKPKLPKQETEPKSIKVDLDSGVVPDSLQFDLNKDKTVKHVVKAAQRSISHRVLGKTKTDPIEGSEQDREKVQKQLKYAQKLRQNLQRLKQQKAAKLEADRAKEEQERKQKEKREQQRKKYLQGNKQKIKQQKMKQEEDKKAKEEKEKLQKQALKQETRKKEQELFEKHKEAIKMKAQKLQQRRQQLQVSREKKAQVLQKLAKEVANQKPQGSERLRILQVHNSLEKGELRVVVAQYDHQLTDLFQSYWLWEKKRIDLNSIAILFRDFQLAPDPFPPKLLAETYKSLAKGQTLDYQGFKECLLRCAYRSQKWLKQYPCPQGAESVNIQIARVFLKRLKMDEPNYKQVIKEFKNRQKK